MPDVDEFEEYEDKEDDEDDGKPPTELERSVAALLISSCTAIYAEGSKLSILAMSI